MAKLNTKRAMAIAILDKKTAKPVTHEGAPAKIINAEEQLRRSVMACLLWEDTFYESGKEIANRIKSLIASVDPETVAEIAIEAREDYKLRHVPLLIVREMARLSEHRELVASTLARVIQRPDELAEFLAIYWKEKKQPLSAQVKKGLAEAFKKFDEYALAKYNRDGAIKLRDVLFLCHAKPADKKQEKLWKKLVDNKLETPDTWEVAISACKGNAEKTKKEWTRLLKEKMLGSLALIRNLRNMTSANVEKELIKSSIVDMKVDRVLPFRFISAARHASQFEPELEKAMFKCIEKEDKLKGTTALLVDVSGSMEGQLSGKSDIDRIDAACGLAILLREICADVDVITFDTSTHKVPARRGFALRDAIRAKVGGGTDIGGAVKSVRGKYDRVIVLTDEQSSTQVGSAGTKYSYMINVASYRNGVGYGSWNHIDGFSESVVRWIQAFEKETKVKKGTRKNG